MGKIGKTLCTIFATAWYGALTFFCVVVFGTALFQFADRFLNDEIVPCVISGVFLIGGTMWVGGYVKGKTKK